MIHDDSERDEMESVGAPMIRLNLSGWEFSPQFEYLKNAPMVECETSDTISPEAVALERHDLEGRNATKFIKTAFASVDDFKKNLVGKELLFFHVFEGSPSEAVLRLLSRCEQNERTFLLDVSKDLGFLRNTPITAEITTDRRFISKPLAELRGLGAWAKGTLVGFEENEAEMGSFISSARTFAHGRGR